MRVVYIAGPYRGPNAWAIEQNIRLAESVVEQAQPALRPGLEGEVQYKSGDSRIALAASELTPERIGQVTQLIATIAAATPPKRVPSRYECERCNIGPKDCPARLKATQEAVATATEF